MNINKPLISYNRASNKVLINLFLTTGIMRTFIEGIPITFISHCFPHSSLRLL